MAFHNARKTSSRDLDQQSDFVLNWINFWKQFDRLDTGSDTFIQLRRRFEEVEDREQRPPWDELRPLIIASMGADEDE